MGSADVFNQTVQLPKIDLQSIGKLPVYRADNSLRFIRHFPAKTFSVKWRHNTVLYHLIQSGVVPGLTAHFPQFCRGQFMGDTFGSNPRNPEHVIPVPMGKELILQRSCLVFSGRGKELLRVTGRCSRIHHESGIPSGNKTEERPVGFSFW